MRGSRRNRLQENPHVVACMLTPRGVLRTSRRAGIMTVEELAELAGECCGGRCPVPLPDAAVSSHHHAHSARLQDGTQAPEARAAAHAEHAGMAMPAMT